MKYVETVSDAEITVFKKKLKMLERFRGSGTELISEYIPEQADRSSVMNQLTEEISQSSNIKSPQTRKNVQGALRKITTFLKNINFKIPKRGLVIFAGNVSVISGRSDIRLFTVNPVQDLKVKLYWCDSKFHLDPLKEMLAPNEFYGLITIDKGEATIAQLYGKKYEILAHFTSMVPSKIRAGGQCLSPSTNIILQNGEIAELDQIKEGDKIKGTDFVTGKTIDSKVLKKWTTHKETLKIETKFPKFTIECSPDHIFFIYTNGKIIEKIANELNVQDNLLFSETISLNPIKIQLSTCNYNVYALTTTAQKIILETRKKENLSQKKLGKMANCTQTEISLLELGKINARKETIMHICNALKLNEKKFIEKYCKKNDEQNLPIRLSKELAEFLGYFEGDGSFEKERISLYDSDHQIISHYSNLAEKIFNAKTSETHRKNKGHFQTRIYGKQIVSFINDNFPEIKKACTSRIPKNVICAKNEILSAFLRGLYDAEGYVANKGVGLGINNQKLAEQIQLSLFRLSIISSINTYNNAKNKYTKKIRYSVIISNKHSLELFKKYINFNSNKKRSKLTNTILKKSEKDNTRQILAEGSQVKEILLNHRNLLIHFYTANMFLNGKRKISKKIFKKEILDKANKSAKKELTKLYEYNLSPTQISQIRRKSPQPMIDLTVENENFIANGLIVHNSSQRFERLREEALQDFFKKIGEKIDMYLLPYGDKLKGIVVGGPGITKNFFMNKGAIHHELQKKILGTVDTSYSDEAGIREIVQKSEELLKETDLIKEAKTLSKFLEEIAKDGLAVYGQKEVENALDAGKVSSLIISEDIEWVVVKKLCGRCNAEEIEIFKDADHFEESKVRCTKCNSPVEILEEVDYIDWLVEKAKESGADIKVVGTDTPEGKQFFEGFGGLAAMLRYK